MKYIDYRNSSQLVVEWGGDRRSECTKLCILVVQIGFRSEEKQTLIQTKLSYCNYCLQIIQIVQCKKTHKQQNERTNE